MQAMRNSYTLFACALTLMACAENEVGSKLYDQSAVVSVASPAELERAINAIADATNSPIRDTMQDLNGLPMFLLSNDDITILVAHVVGEDCDWNRDCVWEYSVTATDASLGYAAQQSVVDRSFAIISELGL